MERERFFEGGRCDRTVGSVGKDEDQPLANGILLRAWGAADWETFMLQSWLGDS